jgi:hypothetical protein
MFTVAALRLPQTSFSVKGVPTYFKRYDLNKDADLNNGCQKQAETQHI